MRRRWIVLGVLAAVAAAGAVRFRGWAYEHARAVTGVEPAEFPKCTSCHSILGAKSAPTFDRGDLHPAPWDVVASPDGLRAWVTCGPICRVAEIDVGRRLLARFVNVGGEPGGVAVSPDGRTLAVSLQDQDVVVLADTATGTTTARVPVGLEPRGLAFTADGARLFVANAGSSNVSVVDVAARAAVRAIPAGREPFRVGRSPDGSTIAVISRMATVARPETPPTTELTLLDATGAVKRRVAIPSLHLSEGVAFTADSRRVLVPGLRVRNLLPIAQVARGWVTSGSLASVDVATGEIALLPLGTVNRPFSDPSGIAVTADGTRAVVASTSSDVVAAVDLEAATRRTAECAPSAAEPFALAREWLAGCVRLGQGPTGVAAAAGLLIVAERFDDTVAILSARDLSLVARIPLGSPAEDDAVHRGERTFHDASFAFQGAFSCRSCHAEGHTDGLAYDFDIDGVGRDFLLNRSLQGIQGTAPFKWAGTNPTLQRQCGPRFAMVLTRADPMPDARLDDLVAYLESLPPPRPAPVGDDVVKASRTSAVERGREIYFRTKTKKGATIPPESRCVTCHPEPYYTNRQLADVGTKSAADQRSAFDVPHLRGVGRKAPYLHDGRARTLEEIWTAPGVEDQHGQVTDLNKSDLNDLVEFLRSL
jgi:YVTN family beta-propeller protein